MASKSEADAAMPMESQAARLAWLPDRALEFRYVRMHETLRGKVAPLRIKAEVVAKADALRLDGWSIPAVERELALPTTWQRHMNMLPVDVASSRLGSDRFRQDVFARLARGMSDSQVAEELGAQPETVRILREIGSAHGLVSATRACNTSDAVAVASTSTSAALRRPQSPQAGTSTGGWTYPSTVRRDPALVRAGKSTADAVRAGGEESGAASPPPKRLRADGAQPGTSQATELAIVELLEAGIDSHLAAKELGVSELEVLHVGIARLNKLIEINEALARAELRDDSANPVAVTPASPESSHGVTHPALSRVEQADPAREAPLPALNTREFLDRLLDEEFADLDMEPFKALLASSPEGRLHERDPD